MSSKWSEPKIEKSGKYRLDRRSVRIDVIVGRFNCGSLVNEFVSDVVEVVHSCNQCLRKRYMLGDLVDDICPDFEEILNVGIVVLARRKQIVSMDNEFFESNFEVAVEEHESDTVLRFKALPGDDINRRH